MKINPMMLADGYKPSHRLQYPEETNFTYFNFTPRSDKYANFGSDYDHKVVFYGLQGTIKEILIDYWNENFFNRDREEVVQEYKQEMEQYLGVENYNVDHVYDLHDLGYLPIKIKALKEGSRINVKIPLFTVQHTIAKFAWLVGYIETLLSQESWKCITIATLAYEASKTFKNFAKLTGIDLETTKYQGHNFAARGMSGFRDDAKVNSSWLLSFYGTDSLSSIQYARKYYDAGKSKIIARSIPASEHSVTTLNILTKSDIVEGEFEFLKKFITEIYPNGFVSYVADSYDYWKVITDFVVRLKNEILNRDGRLILRPDSCPEYSSPYNIICGFDYREVEHLEYFKLIEATIQNGINIVKNKEDGKYYRVVWHDSGWKEEYNLFEIDECEVKGTHQLLWEIFGGTVNEKGYKVLNPKIGWIYGDSINKQTQEEILHGLVEKGFATDNICFGFGSYSIQMVSRDTLGMAYKETFAIVGDREINVYKDPKTDGGMKKSAKGLLRVEKENGDYVLYDEQTFEQEEQGLLETVFVDSQLTRFQTLEEIRQILESE